MVDKRKVWPRNTKYKDLIRTAECKWKRGTWLPLLVEDLFFYFQVCLFNYVTFTDTFFTLNGGLVIYLDLKLANYILHFSGRFSLETGRAVNCVKFNKNGSSNTKATDSATLRNIGQESHHFIHRVG